MNREFQRCAGILMPIASLPSDEGIGSFGAEARAFAAMLDEAGVRLWQILPLGPVGFGNSPYQTFSSFAGDEHYISLDLLWQEGLLSEKPERFLWQDPKRIDYEAMKLFKEAYLHLASQAFYAQETLPEDYEDFLDLDWVYPYAVFRALKTANGERSWFDWPAPQRDWILDREYDVSGLEEDIRYHLFVQYKFAKQWQALKADVNALGIEILGDLPFYVGHDSLDVWMHREEFRLDEDGRPTHVAGCPPDGFSDDGQRWGNPLYDWDHMQANDFFFWTERLRYSASLYDILRIDHFRAFDTYWEIPAEDSTARGGRWVETPGYALFDHVFAELPDLRIIAEDLGSELRPELFELLDHYGLMGMNVALYTLCNNWDEPKKHQLIYSSTHDTNTVRGWYSGMDDAGKSEYLRRLRPYGYFWDPVSEKMMAYVCRSICDLVMIPLPDVLNLGSDAQINHPGTVGSPNWEWHLPGLGLFDLKLADLRYLLARTNRIPEDRSQEWT
ncbi:MAG: 4-alpha-glucanotransferase [Lachnospiraceae bacterium]|nr:4-alpha-glucanotransferase [Lachnospiraceae bacterium]